MATSTGSGSRWLPSSSLTERALTILESKFSRMPALGLSKTLYVDTAPLPVPTPPPPPEGPPRRGPEPHLGVGGRAGCRRPSRTSVITQPHLCNDSGHLTTPRAQLALCTCPSVHPGFQLRVDHTLLSLVMPGSQAVTHGLHRLRFLLRYCLG